MSKIQGWDKGERLLTFIGNNCSEKEINEYLHKQGLNFFLKDDKVIIFEKNQKFIYQLNSNSIENLQQGDIISVSINGDISKVYSIYSKEIDVFMTNQCNSNCVMCPLSETVRNKKNKNYYDWLKEYIILLPDDIEYINITGGEPTLNGITFFNIMKMLTTKFKCSDFQLLTNGRSIADKNFLKQVLNVSPTGMRYAIPLHASLPEVHDTITQAKGSFVQTDRGIKNLLQAQQKVEIRIVVSKKNIDFLDETAKYIIDTYKQVFCVNFIGMEVMGNAAINKDNLWVDYSEAFRKAKNAINLLVNAGIDVQLYNFPLCSVDRGYWHIAVKSITDYKVRYMDECESCSVKEICGGFFYSTKQIIKPKVIPVRKINET